MTTIFWFSGTGNSLYLAKCLKDNLEGAVLYPIKSGVPAEAVGGSSDIVGFVFPSYYSNLPRIVRSFAEKLDIKSGTYIFTIVSMGALGQGSVYELESLLAKKNLRLDYGRGILLNGNYVIMYNPADSQKSKTKMQKIAVKIKNISAEIAAGKQVVKKIKFSADNLYKNIESLDAEFFTEDSCNKCGVCVKVCPAANIKLEEKPVWLHHCEHCVACINNCPLSVIQYDKQTKGRRRYRNPMINVDELM
ncbi:MAG: EFR1 family ferrodoxin [Treponema sp.]|nr:EFR1 family ferrodoxin [Treponema sp.]